MGVLNPNDVVASTPPQAPQASARTPPPQLQNSGPEAWNQVKNLGRGMVDLFHTVTEAAQGNQFANDQIMQGAKNILTPSLRELTGEGQPGVAKEGKPKGGLDNVFGAVDVFFGGDVARGRVLDSEGKTWQAVQAYGTVPLLTFGFGKLLKAVMGKYRALPAVQEGVQQTRANALTAATGEGPKKIAGLYLDVLPELDSTVKTLGKTPNNPAELLKTMDVTMGRTESDYQKFLRPIAQTRIFPQEVADSIRSEIKSHMLAGDSTVETEKLGTELEKRAREWEKSFSIDALDNHRQNLFRINKETAAGRIAARTSADVIADDAAEKALRNVVYREVQAEASKYGLPADYIRSLKGTQAKLYDLLDVLNPQDVRLANRDAIRRGTPLMQRSNITVAGHPESGRLVSSLHGVTKAVAGDPKSLESATKAVRRAFPGKEPSNAGKVKSGQAVFGATSDRSGGTVKMQAPDGTMRDVPREEMEHWKSKGAVVVQ